MLASSLVSFALLALSGVLFDSHRRDWRVLQSLTSTTDESRFVGSRFRRRSIATATIAVVGMLVALWPLVPREPAWMLAYVTTLASLAMLIFTLGVCDAWASGRHYRDESRRRVAEHAKQLREVLQQHAPPASREDQEPPVA